MKLVAMLLGFVILWLVLDRSATALGSFRGEWGGAVAALTLVAMVVVEMAVFRRGIGAAIASLGLGPSRRRPLALAVAIAALLLAMIPVYGIVRGVPIGLMDGWWLLAVGIFAQAGIAEEDVFRAYLFRHLRDGRTFWRAAGIAAIPFVLVHLMGYLTMDPIVATTSLLVALSLTFPFSWLYEQAGNSIWPSAILHAAIQGGIKLIVVPDADYLPLAMLWLVTTAAVPWLVFGALRAVPAKGSGPA